VSALLGPWLFGATRWWAYVPLALSCFGALALFAVRPFLFRDAAELLVPPGGVVLLAAGLLAACALPAASVQAEARTELLRLWSCVAALWMWSGLAGPGRRWRLLAGALLLSVAVMALYALVQEGRGSNFVLFVPRPDQYAMRASGAYLCPNHFASLLGMAMPLALAIAVRRPMGLPLRLIAGYTFAVAAVALVLSQSRSGWIGVSAGLAVTCFLLGLRSGLRRALLALAAAAAALAVAGASVWLLSPAVQERVRDALSGNIRLALWGDTLDIVKARPWLGHGGGSFRWVYPHFQKRLGEFIDPEHAHNDYLELVVAHGIPALLAAAAVAAAIFAALVRAVRRDDRGIGAALAAGAAGALAAAMVHALFDFNLNVFANVQALAMMVGVAWAACDRPAQAFVPPRLVRPACAAAFAAALLLGGLAARSLYMGSVLSRAGRAAASVEYEEGARLYGRAMRTDPAEARARMGMARLLRVQAFWNRDAETKKAQIAESRRHYEDAARLNPWDLEAPHGLAKLLAMEGRDEEARAIFEDVARKVPRQQSHLVSLGLHLRHMKRYEEALRVFEEARKLGADATIDANLRLLKGR
jgi:O-antigen ligase